MRRIIRGRITFYKINIFKFDIFRFLWYTSIWRLREKISGVDKGKPRVTLGRKASCPERSRRIEGLPKAEEFSPKEEALVLGLFSFAGPEALFALGSFYSGGK